MAGDDEHQATLDEFHELVNLTPTQLREWLATDESRQVGDRDDGESTGHASGRRIVEILEMRKAEYGDDDRAHMRKVSGYIKRHLAQRPDGDVEHTRWRYSLMNWGHDPLR
jgi:hypothetical protein